MSEPRFVDVDVDPGEAAPEGVELRFRAIGEDRDVTHVTIDDGPAVRVWAVDDEGALAVAVAVEVEDSSEGVATLVRGGRRGLLLARDEGGPRWPEPYLVVATKVLLPSADRFGRDNVPTMQGGTTRSLMLAGAVVAAAAVAIWLAGDRGKRRAPSVGPAASEAPLPLEPHAQSLAPRAQKVGVGMVPSPPPNPTLRPSGEQATAPSPASSMVRVGLPFEGLDGGCPDDAEMQDVAGGRGCGYPSSLPDGGVVLHGPWSVKLPSGTWSGQYVDGRREGPWKLTNERGFVIKEMTFVHDQNEGEQRELDEAGNVTARRRFVHGAIDGETWVRLPDGSTLRETFREGKKLSEDLTPPPAASVR